MITPKARSLAVDLQAALSGNDGTKIHHGMLDLIEELGGSKEVAMKLFTPVSQCVYMMTLLIQRSTNPPAFKLVSNESAVEKITLTLPELPDLPDPPRAA